MASITTNMASLYAQRNLGKVQSSMPTAVERLSSGLRINKAKDDAAGLGIAEKIQSQVKATTQSVKNANDAISMVQAAEGSLGEVSSILQRMKELTIQGRNGSYNTSQRKTLSDEILALRDEINAIAERTTFNNLSLLKTALRSSVAITNLVDEVKGDGRIFTGTQAGTEFVLEDIKLDNANVGQYNIVSASDGSSITITAIASTTGLSGTSQSNPVGLSQSVNFADIARHEWSNNDAWDASNPTMNVASSATVTVNFDRLGISFVLRNTSNASETLERFETIAATTMTLGAGTMQAVFQGGANTRDTFVVTGFKDVRLFDRNLNSDAGDEDTYRVFSRLNDVIKTIEPQTDNVLSAQNFEDLANRVEDTLKVVTEIRSNLGAQTNRIEFAISNIQAQTEGMTAALGRIRDTDYAAETANLTKNQILQQAATAMLAQANQMPNVVLSLLQ